MSDSIKAPYVLKIHGLNLRQAENPKDSWVLLQYTDRNKELIELALPLYQALYLLDLLEGVTKTGGYDDLRQQLRKKRTFS